MKKTLILFSTKNAYYFDSLEIKNVDIYGVFRTANGTDNAALKMFRKIDSPLTKFFYTEWYNKVESYEKIIVFDTALQLDLMLLKNINKKNPVAQKYVYSWNIVKNKERYFQLRRQADACGFEFYCYDNGNCKEYDMKFNTIMYNKNLALESNGEEVDTIFLGFLKDRKQKMKTLYTSLSEAGLNPKFVIVGDCAKDVKGFEYRSEYVSYYEYLKMVSRSKSILDIAQNGQDGFSMRVMEAIFFDKKLLSTNIALKKADFYHPNNIMIINLEKTSSEELKKFFERPMETYSEKIKDYYSFEKWIERFR